MTQSDDRPEAPHPRHPRLPEAGHRLQGHHAAARRRDGVPRPRSTPWSRRIRGRVDIVLGIESRGFIIGAAAAYALGTGIALVRKPGKLPYRTHQRELRARVRHRHARDPPRRLRRRAPRAAGRRPARHGRHGERGRSSSSSAAAARSSRARSSSSSAFLGGRARLAGPRGPRAHPLRRRGRGGRRATTRDERGRGPHRPRGQRGALRRRAGRRLADQQPGAADRRGAHVHRRRRARRSRCSRSGSPSRPASAARRSATTAPRSWRRS